MTTHQSPITYAAIAKAKRRPASNIDVVWGQELWDDNFGDSAEVPWGLFEGALRRFLFKSTDSDTTATVDSLDLVRCALCSSSDKVTVYKFSEVFSPSLGTDLVSSLKVLASRNTVAEVMVHIVVRLKPSLNIDADADPGFVLVRATDTLASLRNAIRDAHKDDEEEGIEWLADDRFTFLLKDGKVRVRRKDEGSLSGADTLTDTSVVEEKKKQPKPKKEGGAEVGGELATSTSVPSLAPLPIASELTIVPDDADLENAEVLPTPRDTASPIFGTGPVMTTPAGVTRTAAFLKQVLGGIPDDVPLADLQAILASAIRGDPVHTAGLSAAQANAIADRTLASALASRAAGLTVESILADDKLWLDLRAVAANVVNEEDVKLLRESILAKKDLKKTLDNAVKEAQSRVFRVANISQSAMSREQSALEEMIKSTVSLATSADDDLQERLDAIIESLREVRRDDAWRSETTRIINTLANSFHRHFVLAANSMPEERDAFCWWHASEKAAASGTEARPKASRCRCRRGNCWGIHRLHTLEERGNVQGYDDRHKGVS